MVAVGSPFRPSLPSQLSPSLWHPNAMIIGANVGSETDEHEYKSLMVPADKTKKPPPMRSCKDTSEVLKKVVVHSKEINAMLNHHTGGSIHYGIHDDGIVEEGLDLPQSDLIDKLQTRVGQLLQEFYPAVQSHFVAIQLINLVNRSGEPTGRWRFDICVTPYHSEVVHISNRDTVAYYRQGGNSEKMTANMMERLRVERQQLAVAAERSPPICEGELCGVSSPSVRLGWNWPCLYSAHLSSINGVQCSQLKLQ